MKREEILIIIFTAVAGFCFGVYVFWSGFWGVYNTPDVPDQETLDSFTLVSEVYGSCDDTCPSFQVLADGSFRYLYTPGLDEELVIRSGLLPRGLRRELRASITAEELATQSKVIEPSVCNSYSGGIDVLYRITFAGEQYEIDTCGTSIDTDSVLWNTLVKTWNYFETGEL